MTMFSWRWFGTLILLASCAVPGEQAFLTYEESFKRAREAAKEVAVVYSEYDRVLRRRRTSVSTFDPGLADAYATDGLTPYGSQIQAGFAAATVYNDVLARYLRGNTLSLQDEHVSILREAAAFPGSLLGRPEIAMQIGAIINAASALGNAALARSDRAEFVRAASEGAETVDAFLSILREQTRDMYSRALAATATQRGSREKLAEFQAMLGSWVLLIDQTRSDLKALQNAVENPDLARPVLAGLAESAVRIDAHARRIEAASEEIRSVF